MRGSMRRRFRLNGERSRLMAKGSRGRPAQGRRRFPVGLRVMVSVFVAVPAFALRTGLSLGGEGMRSAFAAAGAGAMPVVMPMTILAGVRTLAGMLVGARHRGVLMRIHMARVFVAGGAVSLARTFALITSCGRGGRYVSRIRSACGSRNAGVRSSQGTQWQRQKGHAQTDPPPSSPGCTDGASPMVESHARPTAVRCRRFIAGDD
ncbi:MAG TPA: hypothetical protein DCY89_03805 [Gammaproteobacteria bacterium]|nr:hypothetical protein [Gammaproteobacteria bacterium]